MKADQEGEGCAAPALDSEKWSSVVIAARSKARPERLERLKMAGILRENPGFKYLPKLLVTDSGDRSRPLKQ